MSRDLRWRSVLFVFVFVVGASFLSEDFRSYVMDSVWDLCAWTGLGWCGH